EFKLALTWSVSIMLPVAGTGTCTTVSPGPGVFTTTGRVVQAASEAAATMARVSSLICMVELLFAGTRTRVTGSRSTEGDLLRRREGAVHSRAGFRPPRPPYASARTWLPSGTPTRGRTTLSRIDCRSTSTATTATQ